ncbi:hypothetical protein [Halococcoides cellulosivorans]|uniref:hypothetical protein n=1 Tax=Halococcoides cellulosivorans TaxID=1679096 RepID=UPI00131EEEB3|nr:hypothetical protein [Halococcoides cellulosivorans]
MAISIHNKLQWRESQELKDLADDLKYIGKMAGELNTILNYPREHEDLMLELDTLSEQCLVCQYETEDPNILINASLPESKNNDTIENIDELKQSYKSGGHNRVWLTVGNRDAMYTTDRTISLYNPYGLTAKIFNKIEYIEQNHPEKLREFDEKTLKELKRLLDEIVESSASDVFYILENPMQIDINECDTTDEIADSIFQKIFHYDGVETDMKRLEESLEEVEELRKSVLQASY